MVPGNSTYTILTTPLIEPPLSHCDVLRLHLVCTRAQTSPPLVIRGVSGTQARNYLLLRLRLCQDVINPPIQQRSYLHVDGAVSIISGTRKPRMEMPPATINNQRSYPSSHMGERKVPERTGQDASGRCAQKPHPPTWYPSGGRATTTDSNTITVKTVATMSSG